MKRSINLDDVAMVARRLKALETHFVFTGGSVVSLLMDRPALTVSRPTKDVDVIAEVVTRIQYTRLEARFARDWFSARYIRRRADLPMDCGRRQG